MKRILALWLAAALIAAQPCYAVVCVGFGQSDSATCGTFSFVGAPGEMETFENTEGDFCTIEFTETDASGYISTYSSAAYHGGTYSAEFANTATAASLNHYIRADLGATDTGFTLTFWWKTPNNGTAYGNAILFTASNSTTPTNTTAHNGTIWWDGNGTNGRIAFNTEGASGQVLSTNTFAYNSWYKFVMSFTDGGSSTLSIYNSSETLVETLTKIMDTQAPRYFYWYDDANIGENTYLDDVQYDSTNP